MRFINLANVKVLNNTIQFECLYKNDVIDANTMIYFEDKNKKKYFFSFNKCSNKVNYTYNHEIVEVAKVTITLDLKDYGILNLFIKDRDGISALKIFDNKGNSISSLDNPYVIFCNNYKVSILDKAVCFSCVNVLDRFKYELKKQTYGIKKYHKLFAFRFFSLSKKKYYLFNDRLLYGDDNAEELFKYINKENPDFAKKSFFVLDKNSKSFDRIKKVGKVLKFGSFKHKLKYINCKMVLSSHSSYLGNCFNPFSEAEMDLYKDIIHKNFVFLQHGIVMNDVRQFLNRELTTADLFITSTKKEYNYLLSDDFMYEPNMVIPTGLPRFDKLRNSISNVILISPTWRAYNESVSFEKSDYFKTFKSLLTDNRLKTLLKKHDFKIKFLLHPVFAEYKSMFDEFKSDIIEVLNTSDIKYYELFNECALFITDYSSIHFDVATLKKPIIYFQFDSDFFFKDHYQAGYFDYKRDGFGKVVDNIPDLIDEIGFYLDNSCCIRNEYKSKIEDTFLHLDHNNSKRVFDEVLKLDKSMEVNYRFNSVH